MELKSHLLWVLLLMVEVQYYFEVVCHEAEPGISINDPFAHLNKL